MPFQITKKGAVVGFCIFGAWAGLAIIDGARN
jgi:hypothetical protein